MTDKAKTLKERIQEIREIFKYLPEIIGDKKGYSMREAAESYLAENLDYEEMFRIINELLAENKQLKTQINYWTREAEIYKSCIEGVEAENKRLNITIETSKALEQIGFNERLLKANAAFAMENKQLKGKLETGSPYIKYQRAYESKSTVDYIKFSLRFNRKFEDICNEIMGKATEIIKDFEEKEFPDQEIIEENKGKDSQDLPKHSCPLCKAEFISLTKNPTKFCSPDCEVEFESKVSGKLPEIGIC